MAKTTKATKAAETAVHDAAAAAKKAERLSRRLPKKDAKKLRSLAVEAEGASRASKKKIAKNPRKVQKKADAAIDRVKKAVDKAADTLAGAKAAAAEKNIRSAEESRTRKSKSAPAEPLYSVIETTAVEPVTADREPTTPPAAVDLSSLTVLQLRARAREAGHAGFSRYTKAQLLALLSS